MTIKTVNLDTKTSYENIRESVTGLSPETTLYLNENVVFSEISEEEKLIKSKSIDIDLTQQNTFYLSFLDSKNEDLDKDDFSITLNPVSGNSYSISLNSEAPSISPNSETIEKKIKKFVFKINDTVISDLSNVTSDNLPITSNSIINWNGSDKLSFYFDYQMESVFNSTNEPSESINQIFDHNLELSIS